MKCESFSLLILPDLLCLLTDPNLLLLLLEALQVEPDSWVVLPVSPILLQLPLLPLLHLHGTQGLHPIVIPYELHGVSPVAQVLGGGGFHGSLVDHCRPVIIIWIEVDLPIIIVSR
jgi:hypothetical protein